MHGFGKGETVARLFIVIGVVVFYIIRFSSQAYAQSDCSTVIDRWRITAYVDDNEGYRWGLSPTSCNPNLKTSVNIEKANVSPNWLFSGDVRWTCDTNPLGQHAGGAFVLYTLKCISGGDLVAELKPPPQIPCSDSITWSYRDTMFGARNPSNPVVKDGTGCIMSVPFPPPRHWARELLIRLPTAKEYVIGQVNINNSYRTGLSMTSNSDGSVPLTWKANPQPYYEIGKWYAGENATINLTNPNPSDDCVYRWWWPDNVTKWGRSCNAQATIRNVPPNSPYAGNHLAFLLHSQPTMSYTCSAGCTQVTLNWSSVGSLASNYVIRWNRLPYNDWINAPAGDLFDIVDKNTTTRSYGIIPGAEYLWNLQAVFLDDTYDPGVGYKTRVWDYPNPDSDINQWNGAVISCDCGLSFCGNRIREGAEECDDGNTLNGDGCNSTCLVERICGNGIKEWGESCDDGNTLNGDGCSSTCTLETVCGNGTREVPEECDEVSGSPPYAIGSDTCDTPGTNLPEQMCTLTFCGDTVVQKPNGKRDISAGTGTGFNEDCDDGLNGSTTCNSPYHTTAACKLIVCGNGVLDDGEACDPDKEPWLSDGTCEPAGGPNQCTIKSITTCGDGITQKPNGTSSGGPANDGNEQCDDGNDVDTDNCVNCTNASCGDGYVCSDPSSCVPPFGPGIEACDPKDDPGCKVSCTLKDSFNQFCPVE